MRRDIIVTALLTFCLTATLFMVATSRSQEYDPWADLNEDGIIDIFDVVGVTGIYETTGVPAKNVTVTNWPVRRTLNASLADHLVIDGVPHYIEANVEGYSKMTLVLDMMYIEGSPILGVEIWFIVGGVITPAFYTNHSITVGRYFLLQGYEVIGPTIEIMLDPSGGPMAVSLGIYATD